MKSRNLFLLLLLMSLISCGQVRSQEYMSLKGPVTGIASMSGIESPVTVSVIYDNYLKVSGLKENWGYSVLISGLEKTILYDTGTKPDIFVSNFKKMGLDASRIDFLVISHEHGDHIGGIPAFAGMKKDIPVIIPHSFSNGFKKKMTGLGLEPIMVDEAAPICKNLYTSGEFDYEIAEQCLVLDTKKGLIVMAGCAHPGIVRMLKEIKDTFGKNIYMVFGGFHLMQKSDLEMNEIISDMKSLGIVKCGATHCTGDKQVLMFRDAFGADYVELGVGNIITID